MPASLFKKNNGTIGITAALLALRMNRIRTKRIIPHLITHQMFDHDNKKTAKKRFSIKNFKVMDKKAFECNMAKETIVYVVLKRK